MTGTKNSDLFYYQCTNDDGHNNIIVHWTAPYIATNCNVCPECGWTASSSINKKHADALAKDADERTRNNPWRKLAQQMKKPTGPGFLTHRFLIWKGKQPPLKPQPNYIEPRAG